MRRLTQSAFGVPSLLQGLWTRRPPPASTRPAASAALAAGPALHRIGEISRRAHARTPASPLTDLELAEIHACVSRVTASDLALPPELFDGALEEIVYVHIADSPAVSMAVFVLPPGGCIPLHDHPNMYVFSKVLFGELSVESYDVLETEHKAGMVGLRCADETETAGAVRVLTPLKGNVHCFRADGWTAVFDVVLPPYCAESGRDCTYWRTEKLVNNPVSDNQRVLFKVSGGFAVRLCLY